MKELLRHPQGADVMIDLYDVASTQLRNAMVGQAYAGRAFVRTCIQKKRRAALLWIKWIRCVRDTAAYASPLRAGAGQVRGFNVPPGCWQDMLQPPYLLQVCVHPWKE